MPPSYARSDSGNAHALSLTRHYEYFLPGGDLFLMIDNVQFRVHSYFFDRESPWFRTKMAMPASPGIPKAGTSESTAIILSDVKPSEFARFLWVFYNPKFSIYNAPVEDWSVILRLAHRWTFHEVKDLAIRELQKLDSPDIDRIVLYHDCEVDRNLLIPRYAAICEREEPLNLEEGLRLGLETTLMLARAREYARGKVLSSGERSPISAPISRNEIVSLIRQLFGISPSAAHESDAPVTITVVAPTAPTTAETSRPNGSATTSSQPAPNGKANGRKNSGANGANGGPPTGGPTLFPSVSTNSNENTTTSATEPPPRPPSKNEMKTGAENGAHGPSQNGRVERTGSTKSTSSATDASNDGGKDGKDKNKDSSKDASKDSKDKAQDGTAPDVNTSQTTPDTINTNTDLFDALKEDRKQNSSPSGKKPKGGWLKSGIRG